MQAVDILKSEFISNVASLNGGGLYLKDISTKLFNNTFHNNTAYHKGGAIFKDISNH